MSCWPARLRAVVATLVVAAAVAVTIPASAASGPTLTLVSQDLTIPAGGTASFTVSVTGDLPGDAEFVIQAYTRLSASTRADLVHVLDGSLQKASVGLTATSADLVTPDASGRYTLSLATATTAKGRPQGAVLLPDPGLYPVTVELRSDNKVLSKLATFVVRGAATAPAPLDVAMVLPLDGGPTLQADGSTTIDSTARARLQAVGDVLTANPTPLTLVPTPELLDGLSRSQLPTDGQILAKLTGAVGARQVLATPYVRMDPTVAVESGLVTEFTRQLTAGEDSLGVTLPAAATDRTTWVADGSLDDSAVGVLRSLGVRRIVMPATALTAGPGGGPATLTSTVEVATTDASQPLDVAVADTGLSAAFGRPADPVLAAYQFVAQLDAIALEAGGAAGNGVVVVPPRTWQPDPTFLATLLNLLGHNGYVQPVTLEQFFRDVQRSATNPVRTLAPATPADLTGYARSFALTSISLAGYSSMLAASDPLPPQLQRALQASLSADLTTPQRDAYLNTVNNDLGALRDSVEPVANRRITLTGKSSEIPLTLRRRTTRTIQVKVHLESSKLRFPENDFVVTLDSDAVQQRIPVSARASGTFPLTVTILTPSGDIPVAPATQLTVQATAFSGLGIVLTVGAALVLATWWVRHVRRTRRLRHRDEHPSAGSTPSAPPPATLPAP